MTENNAAILSGLLCLECCADLNWLLNDGGWRKSGLEREELDMYETPFQREAFGSHFKA
jgi:hypothetical protein